MDETTEQTNALKAISQTDDELRVGNYLVVFGGRDLEGLASPHTNPDGSRGEYFTADTELESEHTKSGVLFVDWEHGTDTAPGPGDVLGVVDWKTATRDERGVWVERVLNRRSRYVQWLEPLIAEGLIGTSSEAVPDEVEKAADGQITRWPLRRDTLTVQPMEPRMMTENHLLAFKALGVPVPNDPITNIKDVNEGHAPVLASALVDDIEATPSPDPEASPEADAATQQRAAVDVAKARARLQRIKLSLLEEQ